MTIPDLGHCAASGTSPVDDSVREESDGFSTGLCPACSGRFVLDRRGALALHEARIASEFRELAESPPETTGLFARFRAAITGRGAEVTTQACPCPA